jgi:hypothetical protein
MFPRESSFVTTWLAMYCGDPEFLANQVKDTSAEELSHDRNGWPRIDTKSEIKRLLSSARSVPIDGSTSHDKKAQSLVCVKSNLVRAIVEPISALQFCLRGYPPLKAWVLLSKLSLCGVKVQLRGSRLKVNLFPDSLNQGVSTKEPPGKMGPNVAPSDLIPDT